MERVEGGYMTSTLPAMEDVETRFELALQYIDKGGLAAQHPGKSPPSHEVLLEYYASVHLSFSSRQPPPSMRSLTCDEPPQAVQASQARRLQRLSALEGASCSLPQMVQPPTAPEHSATARADASAGTLGTPNAA
jgi:hypothetical protein